MNVLFFALWFFLPAGIANVTPIFAANIFKQWNYPLDFYKKINCIRIFGDHKTIRGFICGIVLGTVTSFLLFSLANHWSYTIHILPNWYFQTNSIRLGFLLSFGALAGDAMKSFFKRRADLKPGSTWIPFDQIDYIVGGLIMISFIHVLSLYENLLILFIWVGIHLLSTYTGYFLHLKDKPL